MNRLGLLERTSLDADQERLYDQFDQYTEAKYTNRFIYKLDGTTQFVGPFGIQLHTPEVGEQFLGFAKALAKIPGLPPKAREMAILVVGASTDAAYENYAHVRLSGISGMQWVAIRSGRCPEGADESEMIAFEVASELVKKPGPLSAQIWDKAVEVLGISGATALVHYIGFYRYVATILNGFDAQVPEKF